MIPIFPLVSLAAARIHVRSDSDDDADLKQKVSMASGIVLNYIKIERIPADWIFSDDSPAPDVQPSGFLPVSVTDTADISVLEAEDNSSPAVTVQVRVPGNVQSAVLLVIDELYEKRAASESEPLSDAVINLLSSFRDPTFA